MKALRFLLLAAVAPLPTAAQIATDGSAGAAQVLKGPAYVVPETLGKLSGANLFHSFSQFNLSSGESATFVLGTPGIAHVISRVTGGSPSFIDGLLRLDASKSGGTPAFWLLNPRGVLLGENAQLDLPGAFHLSTAPQLRLADGSRWETEGGSSFSAAAPEAFGFLGAAAPVLVQGATLNAPSLQIAAGDLSITAANLRAREGLRLTATGDWQGDVPVAGALPGGLGGFVWIGDGSLVGVITTGASNGGALQLSAGSLLMDGGAGLVTQASVGSSGRGGDIDLLLTQDFQAGGGAFVQSLALGDAPGGSLRLNAARAVLTDDAYFWTISEGKGKGGDLLLTLGDSLLLQTGGNLFSSTFGLGAGGDIRARAPSIRFDTGGHVQADAFDQGGTGAVLLEAGNSLRIDGGRVVSYAGTGARSGDLRMVSGGELQLIGSTRVTAATISGADTGRLSLEASQLRVDGGSWVTQLSEGGTGQLGDLTLQASGLMHIGGASIVNSAMEGSADAGRVSLLAGELRLDGGSSVGSNSRSATGRVSEVSLIATGLLSLEGASINSLGLTAASSSHVLIRGQDVRLSKGSQILAFAEPGGGSPGNVLIEASRSLSVQQESQIQASSGSNADGGFIRLRGQDVRIDSGARILTTVSRGRGQSGLIDIAASANLLVDSARLFASTEAAGNGGSIHLQAQDLHIGGASLISSASLEDASGHAGSVLIQAGRRLVVDGGSAIDSSSFGATANAGEVTLQAGRELRLEQALVDSISLGAGRGGNVLLSTPGSLSLSKNTSVRTRTQGSGDGGSLRLLGGEIEIEQTSLIASAVAGSSGNAGRLDISADGRIRVGAGSFLASTTEGSGSAGSVRLHGAVVEIRDGARVTAAATNTSQGQTGDLDLVASELLIVDGSIVSIAGLPTVANPSALRPTRVLLQAPRIELRNSVRISAETFGNTDASSIELKAGEQLLLNRAEVFTSAQNGNGGSLRVEAGSLIYLSSSQFATSVKGTRGNGGDVSVKAPVLLLDNGFIQANTAASGASGGDINLAVDALLASGNRLAVGGDTPYVFRIERDYNVIQAAAPDGINGRLNFANPVLDLSGSLVQLQGALFDPGRLARSPCERQGGSLFSVSGQGALPATRLLIPAPAPPGRDQPGGGCR